MSKIAEQFEENEQYDKAYEEYKKDYVKNPKSIETLESLGHLALILNKKDDAAQYYSKILELDATSTLAHEQLMDIYFHTDRYKYYVSRGNLHILQQELSHAIADFKKALSKAQEPAEINTCHFIIANLYEQTGKNHQAIDEYLRILDSSAVNEQVFLNLAQIYLKEDMLTSAIDILERARERGFDTQNVQENLAQFYLRNSQPQKARELSSDELVKVKSLLDEGKNAAAFEILEKIKDENKKNPQYYSILAQYYYNTKNWANALDTVAEFQKFDSNSPLAYQMRALIYEEHGKDFESHINWAKYNLLRNDKDVALNEYYMALQSKEDDADLLRNLAELLEETGDKAHSMEFWEKLANVEPRNKKALEKLADFRESIGDYRAQTEALEKIYKFDSQNSTIVKKLAQAYEKLKNKNKALEYYNKFIAIAPVNDELAQIKNKITKLEGSAMEEDEGLIGKIMGLFKK